MLKGLITLLIFQFLGECITKAFALVVPGPVIGMILMLGFLVVRKGSFESLDSAVFLHLRYLPLLFIPAAMGIITHANTIAKELLAITVALFFGTIIALMFSAKLMDYLTQRKKHEP